MKLVTLDAALFEGNINLLNQMGSPFQLLYKVLDDLEADLLTYDYVNEQLRQVVMQEWCPVKHNREH